MSRLQPAFWLDAAVKAGLVGLLLLAVLRPDLPQFEGKAMTGRALTYPLATVIVPVGWWLWGRRSGWRYPYALDICLVLPFLIDVVGNALDLYDTIDWDDFNHLLNWGILVTAFGQLLVRFPLGRLNTAALMIGFGAVTAALWEFGEYYTFIRGGPSATSRAGSQAPRSPLCCRSRFSGASRRKRGRIASTRGSAALLEDRELAREVEEGARVGRVTGTPPHVVPVDLLAQGACDLEHALVVDLVLAQGASFVTITSSRAITFMATAWTSSFGALDHRVVDQAAGRVEDDVQHWLPGGVAQGTVQA